MDTGNEQSENLSLSGAQAPELAVDGSAVRSAAFAGPPGGSSVSAGRGLYVRRFVAEWDYAVFSRWLVAHGREVVPVWALPGVGFVVQSVSVANLASGSLAAGRSASWGGEQVAFTGAAPLPLAVAFGYRDGCVGAVTWLTAAPGLGPRGALAVCSLVTAAVERELEGRGVRLMISPTERPSLVRFMRRRGWRVAHEANVLLWRAVSAENLAGGRAVAGPRGGVR